MSQDSLPNPFVSATSASGSSSCPSSQDSSSTRRRVRPASPPPGDEVPITEEPTNDASTLPLSSSQYFGPALRSVLVEALGSSAPLYGVGKHKASSRDAQECPSREFDTHVGESDDDDQAYENEINQNTTRNDDIGWRPELNYFTAQANENRVHNPPSPPSYNEIYSRSSQVSPLTLPPPITASQERGGYFYGTFTSLWPEAGRRVSEITTAYDSRAPTLRGTDEDEDHGSPREVDIAETMLIILAWVLLISFVWFIASALWEYYRGDHGIL
ncbi:hypothetical protein F5Y18DRAFT_28040 [Xylariaceae sp. FL1019]|nr:hypothetical protein F5Y18DRAFT_28040 [Xylariaceae sp. FL1019]